MGIGVNATKRIALHFNRTRAYGRGFCEGVASWTEKRPEWRLEMVENLGALKGYDGVIAHVMNGKEAEDLASLGIPVVADFYRESCCNLAQALPDHAAIGRMAADFFRERGFVNFAFCGYDGILFSDARREGFKAALEEAKLGAIIYKTPKAALENFDNRVILREALVPEAVDLPELAAWLAALPKPCAVFCCHDLRAYQVLCAAKEARLKTPGDIAIVGVDNDALVCSFASPRITSIDNNAFACGRAAMELLDDIMAGRAKRNEVRKIAPLGVVARESSEVFNYSSPILNEALMFMRRNIANNLTASEIIEHTGKSHTLVETLFKTELGTTVQNELKRLRVEEAKRLLMMTSIPLDEVAKRSGYSSLRYFTIAFSAAERVTPAEFRKTQRRN